MAEFGPAPSETAVDRERDDWTKTQDTRGRIQAVVTGCREPTAASEIARQAQCSTNAARKHLNEFAELGIVHRTETEGGRQYRRNDAYFQWRRANELAQQESADGLLERLAELEAREDAFQTQYSAPTPEAVDIPDGATHQEIEAQLQTLREWETVREAISRHTDAIRMARRSEAGLTA